MELKLVAEKRNTKRKSDLKALRRNKQIPGVIYGPDKETVKIQIDQRDFIKKYRQAFGKIAFYTVELDGKSFHTVIKEDQIDPVSRDIIHLDFFKINENEAMSFMIPVNFIGTPKGVKEGGALNVLRNTIEINCLPKDVPDFFEFNIESLGLGDTLHISDLDFKGLEVLDDKDLSVVTVLAPEIEEEEGDELEEELVEEVVTEE